jgi:hypothetical protein
MGAIDSKFDKDRSFFLIFAFAKKIIKNACILIVTSEIRFINRQN